MRTLIVFLLAGCCAAIGACAQQPAPPSPAAPASAAAAARSDTLARIRALAAGAPCSQDAQCHSLALGERACGGPESYLAWSSQTTPAAEIEALAEIYRTERRQANAASGRVSSCQFMMDPGAVCLAGTCRLKQGVAVPVAR